MLNSAQAVALLQQMVLIRRFEEKCAEVYSAGKIRGFLHLYIGEEAVAVGALSALSAADNVVATYREHAQILQAIFLQQTGKAQQMLSEHIAASKAEVRKITIHMLQQARLQPIE